MKRFYLSLLCLCAAFPLAAQKPQRAIYTEFGGLSNTFSISYDSRFSGKKGLGYSVGLSYGGKSSPFSVLNDDTYLCEGIAVPLEFNALIGGHRSFLDIGLGLSLGYYQHRTDDSWFPISMDATGESEEEKSVRRLLHTDERNNSFGYFGSLRISYRYQAPRGLFLRAGVAVLSGFKGSRYSVSEHPTIAPHLAFGLSF